MKKVLLFGSFDYIHEGHRDLFAQAKTYGTELHVVLARDSTIEKVKGRLPTYSEVERKMMLEQEALIDVVYLGNTDDKYKIINDIKPAVILLGYDQSHFTNGLEEKLHEFGLQCKVERAKAYFPEKYKSSLLKEK
ncbi:MAG: adenylyltransferase/cytidyltransferase family protein [Candidatus Gracilibacteria bacterium]